MKNTTSAIKTSLDYNQVKALAMDSFEGGTAEFLEGLGIACDADDAIAAVMDAMPTITEGSVITPWQFLQHWMPKAVTVVTQATKIDDLVGRTIAGEWHDESIVQEIIEYTGHTRPYGDMNNTPLASFNRVYEDRTVIRFEEGLMTGKLEELRTEAAGSRVSSYDTKRAALAASFKLDQNAVGFFGYNLGRNKTYGILNDPNLPNFGQVMQGAASSTKWETKTYHEIMRDINSAVAEMRTQTGTNFDPDRDSFVLGVASNCVDFLATENDHGKSVKQWFKETFPKARLVAVPEFAGAVGGENCFYIILDKLNGNKCVDQYVPAEFRLLGVEQKAKGLFEVYTNATAGVMVLQPIGVVRKFGI